MEKNDSKLETIEARDDDNEFIKRLCSARVKEMFSLMINEALIKIMPDVKDRVEQIESVSRDHNDDIVNLRTHVTRLTEDITDFQLQLDAQEQYSKK